MAKRAYEAVKFQKGCILLSNATIDLSEIVNYLNSNLDDLMAREEHSKILILDGTHGNEEDGSDGLRKKHYLDRSFLGETCNLLGTSHHLYKHQSNQPVNPAYEEIKAWRQQDIDGWKQSDTSGDFHERVDKAQALRKKLEKKKAKVEIGYLGHFHDDPQALVSYVKACDPRQGCEE